MTTPLPLSPVSRMNSSAAFAFTDVTTDEVKRRKKHDKHHRFLFAMAAIAVLFSIVAVILVPILVTTLTRKCSPSP
ncbi:unnamed protein product [Adineta ricciae]|uniref:Uncharacterized protein n=1 Tax=Adineta ricciae TaxID=249248 RepID=A0A816BPF9_ADIRI|nr:unnamed protein product [Adineta ricciae]